MPVRQVTREMYRCVKCERWWSSDGKDVTSCACGGDLELVDMAKHLEGVPHAPYDTSKDKKGTGT